MEDTNLSGLANCGNTCYINSAIQVILHTYELKKLLTDKNIITKEWISLREMMVKKKSTIAPKRFLHFIYIISNQENKIFRPFSQEDVAEFIIFMIEQFVKSSIKNDFSDSYVNMLFTSVQQYDIYYNNELLNTFYDTNHIINLSIPEGKENVTIYDCFDYYIQDEKLEGENAYYNEKTKEKINVIKKCTLKKLPNILIVSLKRWNNNKKIRKIVKTDSVINMKKYNDENYDYELYGICNHSGGIAGGHYTSIIKDKNKWYLMNDTNVSIIDNIISEQNYIFLYRRKN